MKRCLYALVTFTFIACEGIASYRDSSFISEVKQFIYKVSGLELDSGFYASWKENDNPYVLLYVSLENVIHRPPGLSVFLSFDSEDEAKKKEAEFIEKGYHTFIYKTYATSAGKLNARFVSYNTETKGFIIMHEYLHNYINKMKLPIPYDFNEAIADVVGNYGTMEYFQSIHSDKLDSAKTQTARNEQLYRIMNRYIRKINSRQTNVNKFNSQCEQKIRKILMQADLFQKDRFDYHVNNAYLMKNKNYSYNYFLVKKIFLKQKTLSNFFQVLKNAPSKAQDFQKYIEQYL
jgi:hypothetical protein